MNAKKITSKLAKQLSTVRNKKVQKLKAQISSGQYQVNNLDLARAIVVPQ